MAEGIRISQLPTITSLTNDDVLIVNDGNATTSKITYTNVKAAIANDVVSVTSVNGLTGAVVINAASLGVYTTQEVSDLLLTKASNAVVGVVNGSNDLGAFVGTIIPDNSSVRGALQALETAIESGDSADATLAGDNVFTGTNEFQGTVTASMNGNVIPFYFDNQTSFPSASTYHGAVAHSHADGAMYFAHGGGWVELAKASDIPVTTDLADTYTLLGVTEGVTDLGTFTGGQISANSSVKGALQDLSDGIVATNTTIGDTSADVYTLIGLTPGDTNLGDFDGTTITSDAAVKVALQELETAVEAISTFSGDYGDLSNKPVLGTAASTDSTDYATAAQGATADAALPAASVSTFGGTLIDDADAAAARTTLGLGTAATTDAADYATAAQGLLADAALQSADIGVSVQGYDANTVIDPNYNDVVTGAAAGDTAVQASADAITVTTLATDGSETVDTLAAAINTLTGELAAILNT